MNLNKKQLVKIILAVVISAALAILTVYLVVSLGQAILQWFDELAPRTRTFLTLGMLLIVGASSGFVIWRMRKARRQ